MLSHRGRGLRPLRFTLVRQLPSEIYRPWWGPRIVRFSPQFSHWTVNRSTPSRALTGLFWTIVAPPFLTVSRSQVPLMNPLELAYTSRGLPHFLHFTLAGSSPPRRKASCAYSSIGSAESKYR